MVKPETYEIYYLKCGHWVYIGSTKRRLKAREREHKRSLELGCHRCRKLQMLYDSGCQLGELTLLYSFTSKYKASCQMAESFWQRYFDREGLLINTKIESIPDGDLCRHGKEFLRLINDLN